MVEKGFEHTQLVCNEPSPWAPYWERYVNRNMLYEYQMEYPFEL